MSFGIQEGTRLFMNSSEIESASGSKERCELLRSALDQQSGHSPRDVGGIEGLAWRAGDDPGAKNAELV